MDKEISEIWNFFVNRFVPENFQWENFWAKFPRNPYALRMYMVDWVQQIFDPVLLARSWVSATICGPLAK